MSRAELLPPELLEGLRDLDWAARMVARGLQAGLHRSPFAGAGEEFHRHRPYQQGDDLRHLDWRLLARSDRLYVRRFREHSNLKAVLVVDASASMEFPEEGGAGGSGGSAAPRDSGGPRGVSKARFAVLLAAALGHLLHEGGDRVGLGVVDVSGARLILSPRGGRSQRRCLLQGLERIRPGGDGSLVPVTREAVEALGGHGRLVLLSDFLEADGGQSLLAELALGGAGRTMVTAIRILTPEELGEAEMGEGLYRDPEGQGPAVPGDPSRDPEYLERLESYYRGIRDGIAARGGEWWEAGTRDPLLPLLREWLWSRSPR